MRLSVRAITFLAFGLLAVALMAESVLNAQGGRPNGMPGSFDEARQKYEQHLRRPALFIRTRSAERMASFRTTQGFDLLINRYQRPDDPAPFVQYTTASICGEFYNGPEFVEKWSQLLGRASRDGDSWLWFKGQQVRARHGQLDDVVSGLARQRNAYLRAATLEALASAGRVEALDLITEALSSDRLPRGNERILLVETAVSVLYKMRHELGSDHYKNAATLVIRQLGERGTEMRTKLVIARHLKAIFNEPEAHDDVDAWLRSLERGTANPSGGREAGPTRVQFMDLPAVGDRVVFIIDFSDSMLTPLAAGEREELRGPSSGGGQQEQGDGLPWDRITNRFELAREELKRTVQALPEDLMFCVVVFGTNVELLRSTPRLVRASRGVKAAVVAELDGYRPGAAQPGTNRPHGTLLGDTNTHGAFLRAFRVTDRQILPGDEHVNAGGFTSGADTIFFLSDGAPSCDDFMQEDDREPEDMAGDPEAGAMSADQSAQRLIYPGPYVWRLHQINHLLDDLRRMNLHRKVEMHCIGIGEFDPGLLEGIASIGMGRFRSITGGRQR